MREQAIADYSQAVGLQPDNGEALQIRGFCRRKLSQWEMAVADFTKVVELQPGDANVHNNLAWLLATCPETKVRDPKRAVELAKKAVELAPNQREWQNTLGIALYRTGDWKAAIEALRKSQELAGTEDNFASFDWFFLAMAHWQLGQKEEARKWYDNSVEWMDKNKPQDEELKRFRAEAEELLGVK